MFGGNAVGDNNQNERNNGFHHTNCGRKRPLVVDKAKAINQCINDIGALINHGIVQQHDLLHTSAEHRTERKHQQHDHDGADGGQGDVPDLLPAPSSAADSFSAGSTPVIAARNMIML